MPIRLTRTTTVKARWFGETGADSLATFARTYRQVPVVEHDAVGARVTLIPDAPGYAGPGPKGLTDGLLAAGDESGSAGWVGWLGGDKVQVILDLGKPTRITSLGAHFLRAAGGVALPARVELAVSDDGKDFRTVGAVTDHEGAARRGWYVVEVEAVTARHVRVTATPGGDWTFVDEAVVNPRPEAPTLRHAALGKPVVMAVPPADAYSLPGVAGLTDGFLARSPDFLNPQWLGVEGKDIDATIDLGRIIEIREVGAHFLQYVGAGIRIPTVVDVLISEDGKDFRKAATIRHTQDERPTYLLTLTTTLAPVKGRYVRVVAHTNGQWLFVDEVFVNPEPAD